MRKIVAAYHLLLVIVIFSSCKKEITINSRQSVSFVKFFGTPFSNYGYSVKELSDGGYVMTGTISNVNRTVSGDADVVLIRTDKYGNEVWPYKTFGGRFDDAGYSICVTPDGGYIISGLYTDTSSLGLNTDLYLIRTTAEGDTIWTRRFGDLSNEAGNCVRATYDGGFVIAGYRDTANWAKDAWLVKTDENGNHIWDKKIRTAYNEFAKQVFEIAGGYIMCGTTNGNNAYLSTDCGVIWKTGSTGNPSNVVYIGDGNPVTDGSLAVLPDGSFIFAGTQTISNSISKICIRKFSSNLQEQAFPVSTLELNGSNSIKDIKVVSDGLVFTGLSYENSDIMVVKTNNDGTIIFSEKYGETGTQEGECIIQSGDGGYVIAGYNRFDAKNTQITLMKIKSDGNP